MVGLAQQHTISHNQTFEQKTKELELRKSRE